MIAKLGDYYQPFNILNQVTNYQAQVGGFHESVQATDRYFL